MQTAMTPYGQFGPPMEPANATYFVPPVSQDPMRAFSLRDLFRVINRHKVMIGVIVGLTTIAVMMHQLLSPTVYESTAHVQVELLDEVGTNQADINSRNNQRVLNAARLHRSRSAAEQVIADLDLLNDEAFLEELGELPADESALKQKATNHLLSMISISAEPDSDLLQITVSAEDPVLAANIANQLPPSVREVRNMKTSERRQEQLASLETEQVERAKEAKKASQEVADFRLKNRMLVGAGGDEDLAQLNRIAAQAASASGMRAGSASRSGGVAAAASSYSTAQASSAALDQLERQYSQLISERSRLGSSFGPNHPDVQRVESQLAAVSANMEAERSRAQSAAQQVAQADASRTRQLAQAEAARDAAMASRLQGIASSVEQQAFRNTANSVELGELVRAADIAEQAYRDISTRVEEMRAQMQFEGVTSSIVSPAVPDFSPVAPAPLKMTLIALVGSGILAFMLALVRDVTDDRLRTSAQIRRHFGLPTYGQLPLLPNFKSTVDPNESPVLNDPQSLFAEVARGAYCDVRALRETSGAQTVLVTSPLPGDGKSTVSLTLAAAGLAMGDKTLVIDLDLRKSGLIQLLREDQRGPDLIDLVTHRVGVDQLIAPPAQIEGGESESSDFGEYPHLRILSAHKPVDEPARLLTSARLTQLMAELRNHYDFIVINAPAALAVRDARGMSQFADHTVMVARWGHTTVEQMTAALELLNYDASGVIFDHVDYAEHARHRYGDSVQFYVDSSDYYSDDFRHPPTVGERFREIGARLRNLFPSKHGAA